MVCHSKIYSLEEWNRLQNERLESLKSQVRELVRRPKESQTLWAWLLDWFCQLPDKRLEHDYETTKVLGTGVSGQVLLAQGRADRLDQQFAVKTLNLRRALKEGWDQNALAELEILMTFEHENMVSLLDVYEAEEEFHLVMKRLEDGTLSTPSTLLSRVSESDVRDAVREIIEVLKYLHSRGVVHRDIKPENIMRDAQSGKHYLIDFGLGAMYNGTSALELKCGSPAFVAPEVIQGKYTNQCDMWSLGVTLFQALSGSLPFGGSLRDSMIAAAAGRYEMKWWQWWRVSPAAKDFVQKLLTVDPAKRLTAEQALEHEWIRGGRDKVYECRQPGCFCIGKLVTTCTPPRRQRRTVGFWKGLIMPECLCFVIKALRGGEWTQKQYLQKAPDAVLDEC